MKTVLKIITKEGNEYIDIVNNYDMTPRKDDHFVYNRESYIVSWVEFDFDTDTLYIISIN